MQLRFEPDDDGDAFFQARDALLEELRDWLPASGGVRVGDVDEYVAHASLLFNWQWQRSDVVDLTRITTDDLDEFFFGWIPAKYLGDASEAPAICDAVALFVQFLSDAGYLTAGLGTVAKLMTHCDRSQSELAEVMDDASKFGLGKSVLAGSVEPTGIDLQALFGDGDLGTDELQGLLDEQMRAFNALPFAERKAITDSHFERQPEPIRIPVVHTMPTEPELAESALASELWRCVRDYVDALGTSGVGVTSAGFIRPAEAKRIAKAIGSPDVLRFADPAEGDAFLDRVTSAGDLPWLEYIEALAEEVGALRRLKTKLKARPEWLADVEADPAPVAIEIGRTAAMAGALSPIDGHSAPLYAEIAELLDGGVPHWMTFAIGVGSEVEVDQFVGLALENAGQLGRGVDERTGELQDWFGDIIAEKYFEVFENLRIAGLVSIRDRRESERHKLRRFEGGWFSLTPLGREVFAPIMRAAGYEFAELSDLGSASAQTAIDALATQSVDPDTVAAQWQPDLAPDDRIGLIVEMLMGDSIGAQRIAAFGLVRAIDGTDATAFAEAMELAESGLSDDALDAAFDLRMESATPSVDHATLERIGAHVRSLLDSPSAGHAATYLLERGLATPDEVSGFLTIDTFVDLLASALGDEEGLALLFLNAQRQTDGDLIEDMWRCEVEETSEVLDAIGRHVPDKAIAKSARRAAFRRNSWLANR